MADENIILRPELRCSLFCSGPAQKGEPEIVYCKQEEGKKSSFLLQTTTTTSDDSSSSSITILKPAHMKVEYRSNNNREDYSSSKSHFFLGGFQLVSNAKHVEVYLTDKDGKESYLMTSKGIMFERGDMGEEWYKSVSVIPGGPRPILELHIKLLSLKPKDATIAFLRSLKITARIPEGSSAASPLNAAKAVAVAAAATVATTPVSPQSFHSPTDNNVSMPIESSSSSSPSSKEEQKKETMTATATTDYSPRSNSNNNNRLSPTGSTSSSTSSTVSNSPSQHLTQSDLGAAMSSLSLMAKNAEDRIENAMCERFAKMEGFLDAKWDKMQKHVHSLSSVVLSQRTLLAQKVTVMNQQQETLNAQAEQLDNLNKHQKDMSGIVSNLADDISKIRIVLQSVVDQGETSAKELQKQEQRQQEQDGFIKEHIGRIDTLIEQQRELQTKIHTLQLQVSELSVGLQPIMEKDGEEDDEYETDAGDSSRYNASVEDNNNNSTGDDLMQFPSEDSDDSFFVVEENSMLNDNDSNPPNTKSLEEHFAATSTTATATATTNKNAAFVVAAAATATTAAKPVVVKGGGAFDGCSKNNDSSIAGTADMTDMEFLDHLEKIEVKILEDSSIATKSIDATAARSVSSSSAAGRQYDRTNDTLSNVQQQQQKQEQVDLLSSPVNECTETDFFAPDDVDLLGRDDEPVLSPAKTASQEEEEEAEKPEETKTENQSFGCLPFCLPMFFKPQKNILLPPPGEEEET